LHVVDSFKLGDKPSTKAAAEIILKLTQRRNVLVVLDRSDDVSYKSLRNIQNLAVLPVDQINAYDILKSDDLIFTKAALDAFISGPSKGSAKATASSSEVEA
jgi:large subunit ribosomal protein L4